MRSRNDKERFHDLLRFSGVRPTRQRLVLASILFDGKPKHMTAEAVHEAVSKVAANVSLATVYNTLHCFTEAGLLRKVSVDGVRCYFDTNTGDHHHIYDEMTGLLSDLPERAIRLARLPRLPPGRRIGRVEVTLRLVAKDKPLAKAKKRR